MGDSGLAYQVGTLFGGADGVHAGGILQVVYMRDCSVTWSASLFSIEPGSQVYSSFLVEFQERHGNTADDEHCLHPQIDGQPERTINTLVDMLWVCVLDLKGS